MACDSQPQILYVKQERDVHAPDSALSSQYPTDTDHLGACTESSTTVSWLSLSAFTRSYS